MKETIIEILCQAQNPLIDSHHDIIISSVNLPILPIEASVDLPEAPRVENTRKKIIWSEASLPAYKSALAETLPALRERWSDSSSKSSISILLKTTSDLLGMTAAEYNHTISLSETRKVRSRKVPVEIKRSHRKLMNLNKKIKNLPYNYDGQARNKLAGMKKSHRALVRELKNNDNIARDSKSSSDISFANRSINASKSSSSTQIPFLTVGTKTFQGNRVADGFYDSISSLKNPSSHLLPSNTNDEFIEDYLHILDLQKQGGPASDLPQEIYRNPQKNEASS